MAHKKPGLFKRIVVIALFSLLILSFAAWGIQDIFLNLGSNQVVAKVGDIEVTQTEFSNNLSRETNSIAQQLGRAIDFQEAQQLGLTDRVIAQLVRQAMFTIQSQEMGMTVSEAQLKEEILKIDAFKNEFGDFDPNRFQNTLYQAGISETTFLADLAKDIERQQINNAITNAIPVPQKLAEQLYSYTSEKRLVDYIEIPYARFANMANPSDSELASYYETEKQNYLAPEFKSVSYLHLNPKEVAKTITLTDEQIEEEFLAQKDSLSLPDRRSLVQMLLNDEAQAKEAQAKLQGGADFNAVAKELTGSEGVDLGVMEQSDLLPELADAIFALDTTGITDPIQSPLGWHIVSVVEISPAREAVFEEVREQVTNDAALRVATDELISLANQLDDEIASGANLDEAATKLNQVMLSYDVIDAEGRDRDGLPLTGLAENAKFQEVLNQTTGNDDSLLTELDDGGYFILKVNSTTPSAPRDLLEIKSELTQAWVENRQNEEAKKIAEKLADESRNGTALQAVTDEAAELIKFGVEINRFSSNIGDALAPALVRDIYKAKKGDVLTGQGANGHLVATVSEIVQADLSNQSEEVDGMKSSVESSYKNDVYSQYLSSLRQDFGVEINQSSIEQVINPYGTSPY
ncbi:SurA N-terminal domain-containing protein [Kiloniella sp.]|uniref:SurA N-terminal domain-containing protein n=1 Tax=Kiloniella sp. TaxID=1938587 RepID=UPI003B010433